MAAPVVATLDIVAPRISVLDLEDGLEELPAGTCPDYAKADPAALTGNSGIIIIINVVFSRSHFKAFPMASRRVNKSSPRASQVKS